MAGDQLDQIVEQIKKAAATADTATHEKLINTLQHLTVQLESPSETVQRILYQALHPAICRAGNNLNLFEILSENDSPMTTIELAEKTKCDPALLSMHYWYYVEKWKSNYFARPNLTISRLNRYHH